MNDPLCDQLDDYLLGELPDEEREQFEFHLAGCETCRTNSEQQAIIDARIRSAAEAIAVPAQLVVRAKQNIERDRRRRTTLAAVCLVSAAGIVFCFWLLSGNAVPQADPTQERMMTDNNKIQTPESLPE